MMNIHDFKKYGDQFHARDIVKDFEGKIAEIKFVFDNKAILVYEDGHEDKMHLLHLEMHEKKSMFTHNFYWILQNARFFFYAKNVIKNKVRKINFLNQVLFYVERVNKERKG